MLQKLNLINHENKTHLYAHDIWFGSVADPEVGIRSSTIVV